MGGGNSKLWPGQLNILSMPARAAWRSILFGFFVYLSGLVQAADTIPLHTIKHLYDIKGRSSAPLMLPTDIAIHDDKVYVVDSGHHRIQVFDDDGDPEFIIGKQGIKNSQFRDPVGIDVDSSGRLYVADTGNNRIQIFDEKGKYLAGFDVVYKNKLIRPIDVAVHEDERLVYVSGNTNHRIMGFNIGGHLKQSWGGDGVELGAFRYPATMAVLPDNRLAVVDVLNSRVQVSSPKGTTPIEVSGWGALPGRLFRPKGIALDKQGRIFVSDSYMGVVQVFNDVGKFIAVLGRKGQLQKLRTPVGMAIDKQNRLYIAEMREHKVSVWQLSPFKTGTE